MAFMAIAAMDSGARNSVQTTSKTILVVDDADVIRRLVFLVLTRAGYGIIESSNGKDALDKLRETCIDMVITDLNMPEMDGIELVKTIRSKFAYTRIPVVMMASEFLKTRKRKAFEVGINEWISKPFIAQHLENLVKKYVM